MLKNTVTDRECLTTAQAVERSGLSKTYLAHLLRKGVLDGFQLSRDWFIYTDSLEKFLETPRKSGPKGSMKKREQKPSNETITKDENS